MSNNLHQEETTWLEELNLLDALCAKHLDRFSLYQQEEYAEPEPHKLEQE